MKKSWLYTGRIMIILLLLPFSFISEAETQEASISSSQEKASEKVIRPGPNNIKEKVGIYVFLIWFWGIIFVLIYILRKKVIETDRLHRLSYFDSPQGKPFRKP